MKHEGKRLVIHWFCSGYGLAAGARGQIRRNFWDGTYQKQRSKRNVHNKHDKGGFKRCVMKYCKLTNDYFVLALKGDDFF